MIYSGRRKAAHAHGGETLPLNPSIDKKGGILNPRKAVISTIGNLQEELDLVDI